MASDSSKRFPKAWARRRSTLAKITRPAVSGVYPRKRLFRLLDSARERPVVWVTAPAGAGKTTLVAGYLQARKLSCLWYQLDEGDSDAASFFYHMGLAGTDAAPRRRPLPLLTAEYLAGLSIFTVNFFRELFDRLERPSVVVLDNYQDAAGPGGAVHEIVQQALDQIPEGINVVIISREDPPAIFARTRAAKRMTLVGWEELKLTEEESRAIVKQRSQSALLSSAALDQLHQAAHGWVAGIVLLTEHRRHNAESDLSLETLPTQAVFDYFASEIFRHNEPSVQAFLMKTSFLPKMVTPVAEVLTGEPQARNILEHLSQRNLFTVRHSEGKYEYHPLFRAFLLLRAHLSYGATEIHAFKLRSALLLADHGDPEGATNLLLDAQAWDEALAVILRHASSFVAQGRTQTLEAWFAKLPPDVREGNPWVLYWLGTCRIAFAPAQARPFFEHAFALFETQDDASPLYLAWSGIVESFVLERNEFKSMGKWLDLYESLSAGRKPPAPEIEAESIFKYIAALICHQFDHPNLPAYVRRAEKILKDERDENRRLEGITTLAPYYLWSGNVGEMRTLLERFGSMITPDAKPLAQLHWYTWTALQTGFDGETEKSLRAMRDGLALADSSGVYAVNVQLLGGSIWGQICAGNVTVARELLERMARLPRRGLVREAMYHHYVAIVLMHEGKVERALEESRRAVELAKEAAGIVEVIRYQANLIGLYACNGDTETALTMLAEALALAFRTKSGSMISHCLMCEADIRRRRGEHTQALEALRLGLRLRRETGSPTMPFLPRDSVANICAMALDADIEINYVRSVINLARLAPPVGTFPKGWPWPIRIYTLGRFSVSKDSEPLVFEGRGHKKPMELLRALVGFGARQIALARIAQSLWSDTDGDMASINAETTLHRLRRLIGEKSISVHDRELTLNDEQCWLDVWAFERLIDNPDPGASPSIQAQALLELYRGPFLEGDDSAYALAARERLRSKFLRAVARIGQALEAEGEWDKALLLYQQGIETDPIAEELYRRLMRSYRHLNRIPEAVGTYERCRAILASMLRLEPSDETRNLYVELLASRC